MYVDRDTVKSFIVTKEKELSQNDRMMKNVVGWSGWMLWLVVVVGSWFICVLPGVREGVLLSDDREPQ